MTRLALRYAHSGRSSCGHKSYFDTTLYSFFYHPHYKINQKWPCKVWQLLHYRLFQQWKHSTCPCNLLCSYDSYATCLLTYSRVQSPWEADQFSQLTKKFPAFYGTRSFFTVLATARHLSLSWANSIQSPRPPPTSWTSILITLHVYRY
jgi:hypothetical protein